MLRGISLIITVLSGWAYVMTEKKIHNTGDKKSVQHIVEIRDACSMLFFGALLITVLSGL